MTKFEKSENEKYFKQVINSLNEGGMYIYVDARAPFIMKNNKLVAPNAKALRQAQSVVSKKAADRLFTI